MKAIEIKTELFSMGSAEKRTILERFFKTGKGEYGEGDIFIGVTVPQQRDIVKRYHFLDFPEIIELLKQKAVPFNASDQDSGSEQRLNKTSLGFV